MGKPSAVGQPTRPTQPFILSESLNEQLAAITAVITIGGSAVWWMLYEVKAGGVVAVLKLCDPYLGASEASFSQWGTIQIQLPLLQYESSQIQWRRKQIRIGMVNLPLPPLSPLPLPSSSLSLFFLLFLFLFYNLSVHWVMWYDISVL